MKYTTIELNANQPVTNTITAPLNSDYGCALRVRKNGNILTLREGDIAIEGATYDGGAGDYQLLSLKSGDKPETKELTVSVDSPASVQIKAEGSDTQSNTMPFPTTVLFAVPLSNYITSDTEVTTESFKEFLTEPAVLPSEMWLGTKAGTATQYCWNPTDKHWHTKDRGHPRVDSFTLTPDMFICADFLVPASGSQTMRFKLDLDSGDGFKGNFNLQVQERDLGYVELEPTEAEAAPAEEAAPAVEE